MPHIRKGRFQREGRSNGDLKLECSWFSVNINGGKDKLIQFQPIPTLSICSALFWRTWRKAAPVLHLRYLPTHVEPIYSHLAP